MIDLVCSSLSQQYHTELQRSIKKELENPHANPAIILYPENALLIQDYDANGILNGIQQVNGNGLEKLVFFCYTKAREEVEDKEYAQYYGCVFDGKQIWTFPRHIDIGGPSLTNAGSILTMDYNPYNPSSEAKYEKEYDYPLFEIDGRKVEFRVCWDVWAKTGNKPDVVVVSACGLSHTRTRGKERVGLETVEHNIIINDGAKGRGLTVYNGGKRYDGAAAFDAAKELGVNIILPKKRLFYISLSFG